MLNRVLFVALLTILAISRVKVLHFNYIQVFFNEISHFNIFSQRKYPRARIHRHKKVWPWRSECPRTRRILVTNFMNSSTQNHLTSTSKSVLLGCVKKLSCLRVQLKKSISFSTFSYRVHSKHCTYILMAHEFNVASGFLTADMLKNYVNVTKNVEKLRQRIRTFTHLWVSKLNAI